MTFRDCSITGTKFGVILWDLTVYNIRFESCTITNAGDMAMRYESGNAGGMVCSGVTTTGSLYYGFFSSLTGSSADGGAAQPTPLPSGWSFSGCSFN